MEGNHWESDESHPEATSGNHSIKRAIMISSSIVIPGEILVAKASPGSLQELQPHNDLTAWRSLDVKRVDNWWIILYGQHCYDWLAL